MKLREGFTTAVSAVFTLSVVRVRSSPIQENRASNSGDVSVCLTYHHDQLSVIPFSCLKMYSLTAR